MLEALLPLTLVPVSVLPCVHPVAFGLRLAPLAYVRVVEQPSPDAIAVLEATFPLAVVDLAIVPRIHALPVRFAVSESPVVRVAVGVTLEPLTIPLIVLPLPLILAAYPVSHHPCSVALALHDLAQENCVGVPPLHIAGQPLEGLKVEVRGLKYYAVEVRAGIPWLQEWLSQWCLRNLVCSFLIGGLREVQLAAVVLLRRAIELLLGVVPVFGRGLGLQAQGRLLERESCWLALHTHFSIHQIKCYI